jgi:parallel beta-helix repeat protein
VLEETSGNTIGGTTAGERNVISGNGDLYCGPPQDARANGGGVLIEHDADDNRVLGNYIGTDVTGSATFPANGNGGAGVWSVGAGNTIRDNLISGNNEGGIHVEGSQGTFVGNLIGTDATGTVALGNGGPGLLLQRGASGNTVGGTAPGEPNLISGNGDRGVVVDGAATLTNTLTRNAIWANTGAGIDTVDGGNGELPPPQIAAASSTGVVTGTACAGCTVEIFCDDADEGRIYAGTATAGGSGLFSLAVTGGLAGPNVTATATDPAGNTSEFSAPVVLPRVSRVVPGQGSNAVPAEVTVYGLNFAEGAGVMLGTTPLSAQRLGATALWATIPAGMAAGSYGLTVANPDGGSRTLAAAYTVLDALVGVDDLSAQGHDLWRDPPTVRAGEPAELGLVVQRQGGSGPLVDVVVRFYAGDPDTGGTAIGDGTVPLLAADGSASTSGVAWTPEAAGDTAIYARIDPGDAVSETIESNNTVSATLTVLPPATDGEPPVVTAFGIAGGADATAVQTVTLSIGASDDPGGSGVGALRVVEFAYSQAAAGWVVAQESAWLTYTESLAWRLVPGAGARYLQVWAADRAGNISTHPAEDRINLIPPSDAIAAGQVRVYRQAATVGQTLSVTVTPLSGDPDLYIWDGAGGAVGASYTTGIDAWSGVVTATGPLQIEVYGYSAAEYALAIEVTGSGAGAPGPWAATGLSAADKIPRTAPIVAVGAKPVGQMGLPPAPVTGDTRRVFLPLTMRVP